MMGCGGAGSLVTLVIRELDGAESKRLLAAPSPADALAPFDLAVFVFDSGARTVALQIASRGAWVAQGRIAAEAE